MLPRHQHYPALEHQQERRGQLIDNCEAKTVDGELWVRGSSVMQGYYKMPEETAATLEDGWLTLPLLSDADAASLSRFLASHRVDLLRMEERQKSLEDLFLELTGREESL